MGVSIFSELKRKILYSAMSLKVKYRYCKRKMLFNRGWCFRVIPRVVASISASTPIPPQTSQLAEATLLSLLKQVSRLQLHLSFCAVVWIALNWYSRISPPVHHYNKHLVTYRNDVVGSPANSRPRLLYTSGSGGDTNSAVALYQKSFVMKCLFSG